MSGDHKGRAASRTKRAKRVRAALTELKAALETLYGAEAPTILVYGSQARDEAGSASDVDVLLVYGQPPLRGREITRLSPLLADLNLRYQLLISVVPSARSEYERAVGPFWSNVRREGVSVDAL
jgi:predicted nucleotidyltransferase